MELELTTLDHLKSERDRIAAILAENEKREVGYWTPGMIITYHMYLQILEDALSSLGWMINYLSHHEH